MAQDPNNPRPRKAADRPEESAALLQAELRRRGMTDTEIAQTLRKKKRRKVLEFDLVKSRHLMTDPRAAERKGASARAPRGRPSDELCTVDFAAEQLKLHPKTILRSIRDGRLRATRVGKSYRILRSDLEAFSGLPAAGVAPVEAPSVTAIVDVPGVGAEQARKWARTVPNALTGRREGARPIRADVIYEPEREHLKIVVVGAPDEAVNLLSLIRLWLEQITD
jgi:excisionase family DNA binding protein